jgi:RNA polymerase sigma-70 factor (ECF subfamily)
MSERDPVVESAVPQGQWFVSTRWSVVLSATDTTTPASHAALEKLCQTYWYPLYAYVRRKGHSPEDAQDLTQGFFERFLEKKYLRVVDRGKGKFRSFLLASLEHFLAKEWRDANRKKRGGGITHIALDGLEAEERYRLEPTDTATAEMIYDRRWAMALLHATMTRLRDDYVAAGKGAVFEELKGVLSADESQSSYAEIAQRLAMTAGAVKVAAHRVRARYGELLRAEVADTVASDAEVDEEIRALFAVLSA